MGPIICYRQDAELSHKEHAIWRVSVTSSFTPDAPLIHVKAEKCYQSVTTTNCHYDQLTCCSLVLCVCVLWVLSSMSIFSHSFGLSTAFTFIPAGRRCCHPPLITRGSASDNPSGGRLPAQNPQLDTPQASQKTHNSIHNHTRIQTHRKFAGQVSQTWRQVVGLQQTHHKSTNPQKNRTNGVWAYMAKLHLLGICCSTRYPTDRWVADGATQIFGGTVFERKSGLVENAMYQSVCILAPLLGWCHPKFKQDVWNTKLDSIGYLKALFPWRYLFILRLLTDRQTQGRHRIYFANMVWRWWNCSEDIQSINQSIVVYYRHDKMQA